MTDSFVLHFAPHTCSLASHIVLKEANANYTINRIDFSKTQQQSADYLRINPKGRVPALETPQGVLTETPAMLVYIAQMHPEANLVPFDKPFALGAIQEFNNYLCSTLHVAHAHRMRGSRWADDPDAIIAMQKKVPESVGACYDYIEDSYLQGPWVMGEQYTIADPYLFTLAQWLEKDGVDLDRVPKVVAHRARMLQKQMVQDAIAAELAEHQ